MKLRLSPSTVIAAIALLAALGGTAFAAGAFTKQQKKQVTKIATGVANQLLPGASVRHANSADSAATAGRADTATKALEATTAAKANEATKATEATTAQKATEATTAQRALRADTATEADTAATADRATTAANADALAGVGAAQYQRVLQNACPQSSSIQAITPEGVAQCATPVRAIRLGPADGQTQQVNLGNGLNLVANCTANPSISFQNQTQEEVNINFQFIRSATTSDAGGARLRVGAAHTVPITPRLEGQYTWLTAQGVTTINIHAFDGAGFCEVTGTALNGS